MSEHVGFLLLLLVLFLLPLFTYKLLTMFFLLGADLVPKALKFEVLSIRGCLLEVLLTKLHYFVLSIVLVVVH